MKINIKSHLVSYIRYAYFPRLIGYADHSWCIWGILIVPEL